MVAGGEGGVVDFCSHSFLFSVLFLLIWSTDSCDEVESLDDINFCLLFGFLIAMVAPVCAIPGKVSRAPQALMDTCSDVIHYTLGHTGALPLSEELLLYAVMPISVLVLCHLYISSILRHYIHPLRQPSFDLSPDQSLTGSHSIY